MEKLCTNKNHSIKIWANKQTKYRQFRMFWCKICYNLSRNDFTIIKKKKYGFGWLYRDIFYISQYFWQVTVHISFQVYFFSINY